MSVKLTDLQRQNLTDIVEATLDNSVGYLYTQPKVHKALVEKGVVEINVEITNDLGHIATRATELGIETINPKEPEAEVSAEQAKPEEVSMNAPAGFTLVKDVEIPKPQRGRIKSQYPFDQMEVGQSFFVPSTPERPEPEKSMASTVSSANARYSKPDPSGKTRINRKQREVPVTIPERKFEVRAVADGAAWGHEGVKGAGIWRTL